MANSDITIKITQKAAPKKLGFGIPLLLAALESTETPYTECTDLDAVKAKFGEETALYKAAKLLLMQHDAPARVAVYGSTKKATEALGDIWREGFRQILVTSLGRTAAGGAESGPGEDTLKTIGEYVEAKGGKMLFATVHDLNELKSLENTGLDRTVVFYHTEAEIEAAAALVGATAGLDPGSFTYKNIILKSVTPLDMNSAELDQLHAKGAVTLVTKAGSNVTSEGISLSGEYVDIIDSQDYVVQQLENDLQQTLNNQPKVPYDNRGISLLESVTVNVLQRAYKVGIIASKEDGMPDYTVTFQTREEVDPADRVVRKYMGGSFSFGLAGAVHTVEISGEIVI